MAVVGLIRMWSRPAGVTWRMALPLVPALLPLTVWLPSMPALQVLPAQLPSGAMVKVVFAVRSPSEFS